MTKMIIVFNRDGSKPVTAQPYDSQFESNLVAGNLKHKVLEYDTDNEYYWGDFNSGGIRSLNDVPIIEELAIDELTNKQILVKYPVHKQINIIAECLEQAGIPLTDAFTEMRNYVNQKVTNHNTAVETYAENPNTYSFNPKPPAPADD